MQDQARNRQRASNLTANGTPGVRGTCPVCGTTLFRMGATEAHATLPKPEITAKPARKAKPTQKSKTASKAQKSAAAALNERAKTPSSDKKAPARSIGKLVIVESPAKARSVGQFLGTGYTVKASKGHVRDLLESQLSVDVENDFEPKYRVMNDKRDTVKELKSAVERAQGSLSGDRPRPRRRGDCLASAGGDRTGQPAEARTSSASSFTRSPNRRLRRRSATRARST